MPNKEFWQSEETTHHHSPEEALRFKSRAQLGLMKLYSEKHHTESDPATRLPLELAWSGSYAKTFGDLYDTYPEFTNLVDNCDGSQECLEKIQSILEDETGHH